MMAERVGVSEVTYLKVERGDPGVAFGTYMMSLFALGLGTPWADLVDGGRDEAGLLLDLERLPKRARPRTEPPAR
jgi:transcriptional regulator with XRE-family HTH domain